MNRRDDWHTAWREAMAASSLGWELALPIFCGVLLGHTIDLRLDTDYIFTVGLLFVGVAAGFYNLARSVRQLDRRRQKDGMDGKMNAQVGERDGVR